MAELLSTGSTSTSIAPFDIRRFASANAQQSKAS
jgi:sarcosine oxidase subunit beta